MLQSLLEYAFFQRALLIGLFSALLSATLGVYVVINNFGSFGGAVSHSLLGGIGLAVYLSSVLGLSFITPLWGSLLTALILPFLIEWLLKYDRSDSLLTSLWAFGMAMGTIFISLSNGYKRDLNTYLFGNVLLNTKEEVFVLGTFTLVVVGIFLLFLPQILMLSFDKDWFYLNYKKASPWIQRFFLTLLSLGVVFLSRVVGVVLVVALLTLPASMANILSFRFYRVVFYSFFIGLACFWLGLFLSYYWNIPSGSTIVAVMGFTYFIIIFFFKKS